MRTNDHSPTAGNGAAAAGRSLAFALMALALGACATARAPVAPAETAVAPAAAATVPVPISPGDRSGIVRPDRNPADNAAPGAAPSAAPAVSEADIRGLIGRNEGVVLARLGEPDLRSEAPPARVWHYGAPGCPVDLVFFFDMASGEHRLALLRPSAAGEADADIRCLAKAATERQGRS